MKSLNPIAKILIAAIIGLAVLLTLDPVTAGLILFGELLFLPFAGLTARQLTLVLVPVSVAALFATITNLLYGSHAGQELFTIGPWTVTTVALEHAFAVALRIPAIALPSVVLFITTNSTDLAEALAQIWRLPARFVIAALSAMRLVGLMVQDWRMMNYARRIRGVASDGNPIRWIRNFASSALGLLALSIRRGILLSVAMEARGFTSIQAHSSSPRTWSRESRLRARDYGAITGTLVVCTVVYIVSIGIGAWHFVFIA